MIKKTIKKVGKKLQKKSNLDDSSDKNTLTRYEIKEYQQLVRDIGSNNKEGAFVFLEVIDKDNESFGIKTNVKSYGLSTIRILKSILRVLGLHGHILPMNEM